MKLVKTANQNVSYYYWIFPGGAQVCLCLSVTSSNEDELVSPIIIDAGVKLELSLNTNEVRNKNMEVALSHEEAYKCAGQFIVKKK